MILSELVVVCYTGKTARHEIGHGAIAGMHRYYT
jgi:hypothetical protein